MAINKIVEQMGPATFSDVLETCGIEMIRDRIESAMNGVLTVYECIPGPLSRSQARLHVWRHLRRVIDEKRNDIQRQKDREAEYTGDRDVNSPLNPFRKRAPVDIEDSLGRSRTHNPMIL